MKNELITFKDGTLELNVPVSWEQETVWLTRNQMAELFDRDVKTIGKHINNALKEELDNSTVANFETIYITPWSKRFRTQAFHACNAGFESRRGYLYRVN